MYGYEYKLYLVSEKGERENARGGLKGQTQLDQINYRANSHSKS